MQAYIPANLDLTKMLKEDPPSFPYDVDNFNYIFGTLIKLKAQHKDYEDEEFIPLNAQLLQAKIRTYNKHLQYLVDKGLLKTDGQYIKGKKSRGYKVAAEYMKGELKPVAIKKKLLLKIRPAEQEKLDSFHAQYGYLTQWFNKKLRIDEKMCYGWIMNTAFNERKAGRKDALEIAQFRDVAVNMLNEGAYNLHVDDNVRRFWSNLTNMKKELRNFITYDGQRLSAIDISNSQPFFSIVLFNPNFYANAEDGFTLRNLSEAISERIAPKLPTIQSILSKHPFFMLVKPDEKEATNDLQLYCTLVDKGRLYSYISDRYFEATGIRYDLKVPAEKDKLKAAVFYTMYSDNRAFGADTEVGKVHGEMKQLFRKLFPTVYRLFSLLKKAAYNDLAIILQLIESEIVVRRTAWHISQARPDIPLFTIHDSIATTEANKHYVYTQLKQQCERAIGLMPTLKIEDWK
jgi:hypothetical protein